MKRKILINLIDGKSLKAYPKCNIEEYTIFLNNLDENKLYSFQYINNNKDIIEYSFKPKHIVSLTY